MDKKMFVDLVKQKIKESTEIKSFVDDEDEDEMEEKLHPNKRTEKEKKNAADNVVMFFKELAEDVFSGDSLNESSDYELEGKMALNQLKNLARYSVMAKGLIDETSDLPEWLEAKITIAEENIIIIYNYLLNEYSK